MCAKLLQLCPTLRNPVDCSLAGSSVHGILQQEYWSGLPWPPPGDFPTQGLSSYVSRLLHWQAGFFTTRATWEHQGDPGSIPRSGRSPGEGMATHSSILAGESHGQGSLVGYSPRGHKESDKTERLTLSFS